MKAKFFLSCMALAILFSACNTANRTPKQKIEQQIDSLLKDKKATVGVAVLANDETVAVYNNQIHFPLLSVFKFHVGLAVLDKMDKIGPEGVEAELIEMGYTRESVKTYLSLFDEVASDVSGVRYLKEKLGDYLSDETADGLELIMNSVDAVKAADFKIAFDPTLVRGMSYYTGPIFEIAMDEFGGSVGGGGRYDEMIGKFTGQNTSACGFSIGFERIVMLLLERGYEIPENGAKKAYLIEKNMPADKLLPILKQAEEERKNGVQVNISIMKKNKKFQKEQMTVEGYTEFVEFFNR